MEVDENLVVLCAGSKPAPGLNATGEVAGGVPSVNPLGGNSLWETWSLNFMVQASSINSADTAKLTVLVQNAQGSGGGDDLDAVGAQAPLAHQSHSSSIAETLEDLRRHKLQRRSFVRIRRMLLRRTSKILRMASIACVLRWESCVTTTEEVTKRMKLQAKKAQESLDRSDFSTKRQ